MLPSHLDFSYHDEVGYHAGWNSPDAPDIRLIAGFNPALQSLQVLALRGSRGVAKTFQPPNVASMGDWIAYVVSRFGDAVDPLVEIRSNENDSEHQDVYVQFWENDGLSESRLIGTIHNHWEG